MKPSLIWRQYVTKNGNLHRNLKFSFILSFFWSDIYCFQFTFSCSCVRVEMSMFPICVIRIDSKVISMCHSIQMYHRHFAEGVKVVRHKRSAKIEIVGLKPQFHISGTAVEFASRAKTLSNAKIFREACLTLYFFTKLWFFSRMVLFLLL